MNDLQETPACYLDTLKAAFTRHYEERSDVWTEDPAMRVVPALIEGQLKLAGRESSKSIQVLDLGCGQGLDSAWFANVYGRVTGVDLYPHAYWPTLREQYQNLSLVEADVLAYRSSERYELIVDNGCFHHQHPELYIAYLQHVKGFMAPGGTLVLNTFKNPGYTSRVDLNGRLHRYFSDQELYGLLALAGLDVFQETDIYRVRHGDYYRLSFVQRV